MNVLQKFLTIIKQGNLESNILTLTLLQQDTHHGETPITSPYNDNDEGNDHGVNEVLNNILQRSFKKYQIHFE